VRLVSSGAAAVTDSAGGFALDASVVAVAPRMVRAASATSHLVLEKGRLSVSWQGRNLSGRSSGGGAPSPGVPTVAARALGGVASSPDTLLVAWQGKRIFRVPVHADTVVGLRMDTAWVDDGGIPWNPSIRYGSLLDARDGRVYRTIVSNAWNGHEIQWMAENLAYDTLDGEGSWCPMADQDSCRKHGRTYLWNVAMGLDTSWNHRLAAKADSWKGICPEGWSFPDQDAWSRLVVDAGFAASAAKLVDTWGVNALRSRVGWVVYRDRDGTVSFDFNGNDVLGMRLTPSGMRFGGQDLYDGSSNTDQWMSSEAGADSAQFYNLSIRSIDSDVIKQPKTSTDAMSVRCWRVYWP